MADLYLRQIVICLLEKEVFTTKTANESQCEASKRKLMWSLLETAPRFSRDVLAKYRPLRYIKGMPINFSKLHIMLTPYQARRTTTREKNLPYSTRHDIFAGMAIATPPSAMWRANSDILHTLMDTELSLYQIDIIAILTSKNDVCVDVERSHQQQLAQH